MIGEVICGGPLIEQRPFGSIGSVQRLRLDLRYARNRSTYGNIFALTMETGYYLKTVLQLLDAPDIKKAFDGNTKWDVIEIVFETLPQWHRRTLTAHQSSQRTDAVSWNLSPTTTSRPPPIRSCSRPRYAMGPHAEA